MVQIETLVDTATATPPGRDARKWCVGIAVDARGRKGLLDQKGGDNAGQGRIFRANLEIPQGQGPANREDIELLFEVCLSPSTWISILPIE